jgi:NADP-dependent 3-hydroxy acid dehydrogenase YdfG
VETEFSRVRFGGDEQREAAVYERVTLLSKAARTVLRDMAVTRLPHVNVDAVAVTARAQVAGSGQQFHRR